MHKLFLLCSKGTGGGDEYYHDLCVLPKDVVAQKFYSFWFMWLAFLVVMSTGMLILRFSIVFFSGHRELMMNYGYGIKTKNVVSNHI